MNRLRTRATLASELRGLGLPSGATVIVHTSLKAIGGWICGGAEAYILALKDVLGPEGTLVMPAFNANLSDPKNWIAPPVPEEWWPIIRDQMPGFDLDRTPSAHIGVVPELFRNWPGTRRSNHPRVSFCANGPLAELITSEHPLGPMFGASSPLGKLHELDAHILLVGVGYDRCTALHLSEALSANRDRVMEAAPFPEWVQWEDWDYDSDGFPSIGEAYEREHEVAGGRVGDAVAKLMQFRTLVDFGVEYLAEQ